MDGVFVKIQSQACFNSMVEEHYRASPSVVSEWLGCVHEVGSDRVELAFNEYNQSLQRFSVLLQSSNPDHYKRSGALLYSLYKSQLISGFEFTQGKFGSLDDLEGGTTMVSHGDAQHVLRFVDFYKEFHQEFMSFDLAYRCCATYEEAPVQPDFDYIRNVCRFMKVNTPQVDAFFMIFKSLMAR